MLNLVTDFMGNLTVPSLAMESTFFFLISFIYLFTYLNQLSNSLHYPPLLKEIVNAHRARITYYTSQIISPGLRSTCAWELPFTNVCTEPPGLSDEFSGQCFILAIG